MKKLEETYAEIDEINKQICKLHEERMKLQEKVALAQGDECRGQENANAWMGFTPVKAFCFEGARIVFQGTEGAYSQQALREYFNGDKNSYHVETWRDAMDAIANGEADYAVLPIENSSAGIVTENFDLLVEYDNCIIGEQIIKIDHCLLGQADAQIEDITDVYSHPQALMQCSKYLDENYGWEKHSMKNTAVAAKKVKEDGNKNKAAIAARINADIYGLKILKEGIQNNTSNSTKFIIVTGKKVFLNTAEKISISFEIPHESGSLYRTLSHFIYNNLNLNKIESRPLQKKAWEYRFFIDVEGNLQDKAVQNALRGLQKDTEDLKILGNYKQDAPEDRHTCHEQDAPEGRHTCHE